MHIGKDVIWKRALEDSWSFAAIKKKVRGGSRAVHSELVPTQHLTVLDLQLRTVVS